MSTPPLPGTVVDPNDHLGEQMFADAYTHGRRLIDVIQNAAADGVYLSVWRLDGQVVVRAMKSDQDLYITKNVLMDYSTLLKTDNPQQVTVPLDPLTAGFIMGPTTLVSDDYDALSTDTIIRVDATAKQTYILLPLNPVPNEMKIVKKVDATDNAVTIRGNGRNIDGQQSIFMLGQSQTCWLQFNGTDWDILVAQTYM